MLACTCHCQLPRSPCAPLATTHNPLLYAVPFITDTKKFEHEDRPSLDCSGTRLKHWLAGRELRGLQVLDICKFQFLKSEMKIEVLQLFITAVQNFIIESCSWDRILMLLLLIRSGVCSGLFSFVGNIYILVWVGESATPLLLWARATIKYLMVAGAYMSWKAAKSIIVSHHTQQLVWQINTQNWNQLSEYNAPTIFWWVPRIGNLLACKDWQTFRLLSITARKDVRSQ